MKRKHRSLIWSGLGLAWLCHPSAVFACSVCFGNSNSTLSKALHWGVLMMLGLVVCVLAGIAAFFIYVAKRPAAAPDTEAPATESAVETVEKV
ncbi:MAG: hypothetical protein FJ403_08220 [Verrucomicrobia bacterium]|nr:hypothetical protein [Verrucomicrobiota bacterium]